MPLYTAARNACEYITPKCIIALGLVVCLSPYCYSQSNPPALSSALLDKAKSGDPEAQQKVGIAYLLGQGTATDESEGIQWLRKAADNYNRGAEYDLGLAYQQGKGVPKDAVQAVTWYTKAANEDLSAAQAALGYAYAKGLGVNQNLNTAEDWFRKAANQGDVTAGANLGMLLAGTGIQKNSLDLGEAVFWLKVTVPHLTGEALENAVKDLNLVKSRVNYLDAQAIDGRIAMWIMTHPDCGPAVAPSEDDLTNLQVFCEKNNLHSPCSEQITLFAKDIAADRVLRDSSEEKQDSLSRGNGVPKDILCTAQANNRQLEGIVARLQAVDKAKQDAEIAASRARDEIAKQEHQKQIQAAIETALQNGPPSGRTTYRGMYIGEPVRGVNAASKGCYFNTESAMSALLKDRRDRACILLSDGNWIEKIIDFVGGSQSAAISTLNAAFGPSEPGLYRMLDSDTSPDWRIWKKKDGTIIGAKPDSGRYLNQAPVVFTEVVVFMR